MKIYIYTILFLIFTLNLYSGGDTLIAYWSFDDGNCLDYSGNHLDGTPVNNPTYVIDGVSGKAIHLEGKNWYINEGEDVSLIGSHVLIPFIDFSKLNEFTISIWVRYFDMSIKKSGESYIFFGHHNLGWLGIFNHIFESNNDGILRIIFAVGGHLWDNNIQIPYNENLSKRWVHYALVYDNNLLKGYVDGVKIGEITQKVSIDGNRAAIGRHWWYYDKERSSAEITGDIDEVKIFSKALSDDEVKKLANPCENYFTFSVDNNNSLDFDSVGYATTNCKQIKITNISDTPKIISQTFMKYNIDFSVPQSQLPLIIQPQETKTLPVCFTPTKLGYLEDTLLLPNNCDTFRLPLSGIGSPNYYSSKTKCEVILAGKTVQIVNGGYLNVKTDYIQKSQNLKIFIQTNFEGISNYEIYIYNYFGQRVKECTFHSINNNLNEFNLPFEGMPKGTYLIVLKAGNNIYSTTSLIF